MEALESCSSPADLYAVLLQLPGITFRISQDEVAAGDGTTTHSLCGRSAVVSMQLMQGLHWDRERKRNIQTDRQRDIQRQKHTHANIHKHARIRTNTHTFTHTKLRQLY